MGKGPGRLADKVKLKRTFYLDRDSVLTLSELQTQEFRDTGHKPDLSELVVRAIRHLRRPSA